MMLFCLAEETAIARRISRNVRAFATLVVSGRILFVEKFKTAAPVPTHELVIHADCRRQSPDLPFHLLLLQGGLLFAQKPAHKVVSVDYRAAHECLLQAGDDECEHDRRRVDDYTEH